MGCVALTPGDKQVIAILLKQRATLTEDDRWFVEDLVGRWSWTTRQKAKLTMIWARVMKGKSLP